MKLSTASFVAFVFGLLPFLGSLASAQAARDARIVAVVIADVTATAECSLSYSTLDGDIVVNEYTVTCPAGSVVSTRGITAAETRHVSGLVVRLTGDTRVDRLAVESAQNSFKPASLNGNPPGEEISAASCEDRSFRASFSYYATDPGVKIYGNVYYSQSLSCVANIGSGSASLGWAANVYWDDGWYEGSNHYWSHGCGNLSYGALYQQYNRNTQLGYWVYDTVNNNSNACRADWSSFGQSYRGAVQLLYRF